MYFTKSTMTIRLSEVFYYAFLLSFFVILFVNLLPGEWSVLTRPFVLFAGLISILLINNLKAIVCILSLYFFVLIYALYPMLNDGFEYELFIKNTKYLMYFVFLFGLTNLLGKKKIEVFLYAISKIFILKLFFVALISINLNFLGGHFLNFLLDDVDLIVHKLFGIYRVFDLYLFLFPVVFVFLKGKSLKVNFLVHFLLFFNVLSSLTFGMFLSYLVVMFIRYTLFRGIVFLLIPLSFLFLYEFFANFFVRLLEEKTVSIEVKINQLIFLLDNFSVWGQGLGKKISILGRTDSMLENIYIYWFVVYGDRTVIV